MKQIKTQKELDALCKVGVKEGEEVDIVGEGLTLNTNLSVFGFLRISAKVDMDWYRGRVVAWGSSSVEAWGSSSVEAWGSSSVEAWGSSRVEARGSSSVVARESSSVVAWGSSRVEAWGSSRVVARESSSVVAWGSSRVEARESSRVVARGKSVSWNYSASVSLTLWGWTVSYKLFDGKGNITKKSKTATVIEPKENRTSFEWYQNEYPVEVKGKKATLYKAVHKYEDGTYHAHYDSRFVYEIGKVHKHENAPSERGACAPGLHVAHKSWARYFGYDWEDCAILECEVDVKDIVVSKDCDGKVRTSKLKVIRELPKEEWI